MRVERERIHLWVGHFDAANLDVTKGCVAHVESGFRAVASPRRRFYTSTAARNSPESRAFPRTGTIRASRALIFSQTLGAKSLPIREKFIRQPGESDAAVSVSDSRRERSARPSADFRQGKIARERRAARFDRPVASLTLSRRGGSRALHSSVNCVWHIMENAYLLTGN